MNVQNGILSKCFGETCFVIAFLIKNEDSRDGKAAINDRTEPGTASSLLH